ncbi:galectin-7-like isoform X1 [Pelodiscus sinensis]|uniref:galectin-7-like isoform X1 n=1 Tax=Pelodiscus sinensis TaxID=13735 RepID=UPI003F6B7AB9
MVTAAMALIPDKLTIPYSMAFPEGLWPPTWVKIQGSVPETSTGFQVKFLRGQYKEANVALLFSHCFQGSSHILLNSLVEKKWGQEQREDNSPLCKGGSFTLMFTITDKEYQVTANEHHYFEFQHRLPPEDVHYLEVHGEVQLEAVSWGGGCCDRSCPTEVSCPGASSAS